ncbi:MAG: bifunctional 3-(3-hydroxy-phenyl)propionate/3-hydroxycinnamic acid hydroxylase [Pseudomonadota bacterium]
MNDDFDGSSVDVVVIGFGPSGAVASALLGQAGLNTLVIERQPAVYEKPRAIALDHEIMRVFQQIGVADEVVRWSAPFTPSEYYGADGQLIKRLATVAPPYPLGYTPSMVFTQPPVEKALRLRVASMPNVQVALGQEFVSLTQDAERVSLSILGDDSVMRKVTSRYVLACDGASSTVRGALGIELEDLEFDEPWLVVDVLVNESALDKLPQTSVQYCEPERPCTYVIGPGNHRRWEISLLPGEDPAYIATEEGAWSLLRRWITPDDASLWRQACYRFHALVARDWHRGRVFIAGDAAHQQPPFLGQGMCQGIRDVANLSWKLRAVLSGRADGRLLDTYAQERGCHVRQLTGRIKEIGRVICERNLDAARLRDAELLAEAGGQIKTTARQDIIPRLDAGLLSLKGGSATGSLFPQPKVAYGGHDVLLDEISGCEWRVVIQMPLSNVPVVVRNAIAGFATLICLSTAAGTAAVQPHTQEIEVVELEGVMAAWFDRHHCVAALVRPDHYVFGTAAGVAELMALLDEVSAVLR